MQAEPAAPAADAPEGTQDTLLGRLPTLTEAQQERLRIAIGSTEAYRLIEQKLSIERHLNREERRGMGILRYTTQNQATMRRVQTAIDRELATLGVATEADLLYLVDVEIPELVLGRAKAVGLAMLARNEDLARAEMARYADQVCSPDTEGLLAADEELAARYRRVQSTQMDIDQATRYMGGVPGGTPQTAAEFGIPPEEESVMVVIMNLSDYRDRLELQKAEYEQMRTRLGAEYPILLAKGYEPGAFSSAPREELSRVTAEPLQDILNNIDDVRDDIEDDDMKVWNIRDAVQLAVTDLGIARNEILLDAVEARIRQKVEDESFIQKLKIALAITTTILAGILVPGYGAVVAGTLWSAYFLHGSLGEYLMELHAENVAMDPEVRDISLNEPELLWVVLDAIALGLDVGAFIRVLRPLARAALRTRRIAEFSEGVRRLRGVPAELAERLVRSLRQRLGRELIEEAAPGAVRAALGEGLTLEEYVGALRSEAHEAGSVGRSWDYTNHPVGLPESQWRPGMPVDMPNSRGTYPPYDTARQRYWRNRAHVELEARARGAATHRPGVTTDPVAGLSDEQLRDLRESGRAPEYAFANSPGQTWELEHHGVPQRVGAWLRDLGFDGGESSRLIQASHPGALMEVTPVEHAFFDEAAWRFGSRRADVTGARWATTAGSDIREMRPLYYMSDETIQEIIHGAARRNLDFAATEGTRQLRDALEREVAERGLRVTLPGVGGAGAGSRAVRASGGRGGLKVLVVGAETEAEFAYAADVAGQGHSVTVVNPRVTPEARAFRAGGGDFRRLRIESLPQRSSFNIIREDFPVPLGRMFTPTADFVAERLTRLASGGHWIVVTEASEFAETLESVARVQGANVTRREFAVYHEATPVSPYPREQTRIAVIVEKP